MTVIPVDYAQVTHLFGGAGLPNGAAVTYGIRIPAADPGPVAVATLCRDNFAPVMTSLANSVSLINTKIKYGPNDDGAQGEFAGAVVPGSVGSETATPNVAYLVEKTTNLGGRRGRGRFFLPGVYELGVTAGGSIDAGVFAALQGDLTTFHSAMTVDDCEMFLLHSFPTVWIIVEGQPRRISIPGIIPDPTQITSLSLDPIAATQRRRLRS